MLRAILVAMVLTVGCGGGGDASNAPGTVSAAPAGKVREVTGKVTAVRGSETRTLAVGMPIQGDELIDTGTDGSVVIELAHNNALWSLEPGIKARVDQSPAWALAKQDAAKPVEHATSSAGRDADRQGADTKVTALDRAKTAPAKPVAPPAIAPGRAVDAPRTEPPPPPPPLPKTGKLKVEEASAAGEPDAPDRTSIMNAIKAVVPRVQGCGTAKGTFKFTIRFGPDGKVATAQVKESPDPAMDACALAVIKTATVPRSKNGVTVGYPIILR